MNKLPERIRIKDIARLANVSVGTVDRVLHGRSGVSEASRKRVEEILKNWTHQPNYGMPSHWPPTRNTLLPACYPSIWKVNTGQTCRKVSVKRLAHIPISISQWTSLTTILMITIRLQQPAGLSLKNARTE